MYINKGQIQHEYTKAQESVEFLHSLVYDGHIDRGFAVLPKAEQIAVIGLLHDAVNYRNSLAAYMNWFEDQNKEKEENMNENKETTETINKNEMHPFGLLHVSAHITRCEDGEVDDVVDIDTFQMDEGEKSIMPCMSYNHETDEYRWEPIIDIATGQIINWEKGKTAVTNYKVVDECSLAYEDFYGTTTDYVEDYVPDLLCPDDNGYGDYMYMTINADGFIDNWDDEEAKRFVKANLIEDYQLNDADGSWKLIANL